MGLCVGHAPCAPATDSRPDEGRIAFFACQRGCRGAGQALLEAAEARLRELGMGRVVAFHQDSRCLFYHLQNAFLSDRLEHIHALFGMNGYARVAGEVFLNWPDYQPLDPGAVPAPVEISLQWRPREGMREGLALEARRDDEQVGACTIEPCSAPNKATESGDAGECAVAEAYDWCFVTWLGVAESLRGQGVGRYLLQRGLFETQRAGYRHAAISTAWKTIGPWRCTVTMAFAPWTGPTVWVGSCSREPGASRCPRSERSSAAARAGRTQALGSRALGSRLCQFTSASMSLEHHTRICYNAVRSGASDAPGCVNTPFPIIALSPNIALNNAGYRRDLLHRQIGVQWTRKREQPVRKATGREAGLRSDYPDHGRHRLWRRHAKRPGRAGAHPA